MDGEQRIGSKKTIDYLIAVLIVVLLIIPISLLRMDDLYDCNDREDDYVTTFKIGMIDGVTTANPYLGNFRYPDNDKFFHSLIYDSLIAYDEDMNPVPNLASSWWYMDGPTAASLGQNFSEFIRNINPTDWPLGSIWEYNITEDVFWSDGEEFTAYDVDWTINMLSKIKNIMYAFSQKAYHPTTFLWISHAEFVDEMKVRIFFENPWNSTPSSIPWGDNLDFYILPKHRLEGQTLFPYLVNGSGVWSNQTHFYTVGTGPFMVHEERLELLAVDYFQNIERLNLIRNPYCHFEHNGTMKGLGAAYDRETEIDKLLLKFFSEESTLSIAVRIGDIDTSKISANTYRSWINDDSLSEVVNLMSFPSVIGHSKQFAFNALEDTPETYTYNQLRLDPAVQRAAVLATNKSEVIETVYKGLAAPGIGLISPARTEWWWEPDNELSTFYVNDSIGNTLFSYTKPMKDVMEHDPELSNDILDAAGYSWSGEEGNSVRYATQVAADRMEALFGIPAEEVNGTALSFELIISAEKFRDRQIANSIIETMGEVGFELELSMLTAAEREARIYTYTFECAITTWQGDVNPNYLLRIPTSSALYGFNEFGTSSPEYDALYELQQTMFDYNERKIIVDECLKWQYLSGSINTICYPNDCYAYNNLIWTNWGNWTEHPGLVMDAHWGENPLWFNLESVTCEVCNQSSIMWIGVFLISVTIAATVTIYYFILRKRISQEPK